MAVDWDPVTSMYVERVIPPWVKVAEWNNNRAELESWSQRQRQEQLEDEFIRQLQREYELGQVPRFIVKEKK